ncbi:MAG: hypothetical protein NT029_20615 [Armatimonadetes bacterium]|nr:hypothetical protein [Armatimonadota bacterium]
MSNPVKVCPRCTAQAAIEACLCQACGHQYRTQFSVPLDRTQPVAPAAMHPTQVMPAIPTVSPQLPVSVKWIGYADILTNASLQHTHDAVAQAFHMFGVERVVADPVAMTVRGTTKADLVSAGQNVEGRVFATAQGTQVCITSRPKMQLFDWGRGKKEARRIVMALVSLLQQR